MSCDKILRREMIEKRKAEGKTENGERVSQLIRELDEYKRARIVMVYMPVKGEIDVTSLLNDEKTFLLPVTEGDNMHASLTGELEEGDFKVPVPKDKRVFDKTKIDIVIVPGVVFDKNYNRMGYGKGYYDRFLKDTDALKIGVCHAFQMLDTIKSEEHDIKMDMIITEDKVWRKGNTLSA